MDSRTSRRTRFATVVTAVAALTTAAAAPAAGARPDLRITRVSCGLIGTTYGGDGECQVAAGATLRLAERTKNAGSAFAPRSATRWMLRARGGQTRVIASHPVEALASGGSAAGRRDVVVPNLRPGRYILLACADGRRGVRERNELNNCRAATRDVLVRANRRSAVFIGGGAAAGAVIGFREDSAPVQLASGLTVTDADDSMLSGATVALDRPAPAWLFYTEQLGITGSYNTGTGVLTLVGRAPVRAYQTALRSVLYQHQGDNPPASQTAQIVVRDAKGAPSAPVTRKISIDPVNDVPEQFATEPPDRSAPDRSVIGRGIGLFDPDSDLARATIEISSGYDPATDALAFENQLGITGSYDSGTGTLTLTGTASPGNYQAALRTVRFVSSSSSSRQRAFDFQVTDAQGASSFKFHLIVEALP